MEEGEGKGSWSAFQVAATQPCYGVVTKGLSVRPQLACVGSAPRKRLSDCIVFTVA